MAVVGDSADSAAAGVDFLEWLGPDTSAVIFDLLREPADIARASAVSRPWRTIVLATHFSKIQCLKLCPEVANFVHIEQISAASPDSSSGRSSAAAEWENHRRKQRVYTCLAHSLPLKREKKDCIAGCVGASSTDNFPLESIEHTLNPKDIVALNPEEIGDIGDFQDLHLLDFVDFMLRYWSSRGHADPGVPECLIYKLCSDLCLIDEIKIQPFRAFFQDAQPIYSSQYVRFRFGCPKSPLRPEDLVSEENEGKRTADNNYIWTYTSPEFPMLQEYVLQSFKLPRPVLCIGGVVKVELLGRIQKQEADNLYYLCVSHVKILGSPLSSEFGAAACDNDLVLKYYLDPDQIGCSESSGNLSKWCNIEERFWQQVTGQRIRLNQELVSRLLGPPFAICDERG